MADDEIPEEWKQQYRLFFKPLENNTGCMGGLLFFIWITLLIMLWRIW